MAEGWTREAIRARVLEEVPGLADVVVREDAWRPVFHVTLRASRTSWRRGRGWRRAALLRACVVLSDSPAGVMVRVRWA